MHKSLYEIQSQHAALVTELLEAGGEITPELEFALNINKEELNSKAEGYALRILEFNGQAQMIAVEIDRLAKMKQSYEKTAALLKETIQSAMVQFGVDKIKGEKVSLSLRKSESVEVPEGFIDEVLRFVKVNAEWDIQAIVTAKQEAESNGQRFIDPPSNVLDFLKLKADLDKTKVKSSIKDGTTVGDIIIVEKKNLQIK